MSKYLISAVFTQQASTGFSRVKSIQRQIWHQLTLVVAFWFCRFFHICVPLRGKGQCEAAVEDIPVLWQDEAGRELR